MFCRVSIIGVGLIGGSLGLALKQRQLAGEVIGFDINDQNIKMALFEGAIDKRAESLVEAVQGADLVVLAVPVLAIEKALKQIAKYLKPKAIVTDVGSVKSRIIEVADKYIPENVYFIGGHPMAGSEVSGMKGADPYLFENAYYILTPSNKADDRALRDLRVMLESLGAHVVEMPAQKHDRVVALLSHLPHLTASALVNTLAKAPDYLEIMSLAAGGFRDTTRVASGNPLMWKDIFQANRDQLLDAISMFRDVLDEYERLIISDERGLVEKLEQAKKVRSLIPERKKGYLPVHYEVLLSVPDKPGIIADFSAILGKNKINIADLEILRVREGCGGTMRLAFATKDEQNKAVKVLVEHGYKARALN
ncbi:prephenate dehydrogenase [Peptococcaceae bacterium]|nr:prephenate dehydrogenase [Peptococcaceae bacterium]